MAQYAKSNSKNSVFYDNCMFDGLGDLTGCLLFTVDKLVAAGGFLQAVRFL
jgi:hypothetical protein